MLMSRSISALSSSVPAARTWLGKRLQGGRDGYRCLAGRDEPARRRSTTRSSEGGPGPIHDPQLLGARNASAHVQFRPTKWCAAAVLVAALRAGVVMVVPHDEITSTPGPRHSRCTNSTLSERGRLAGRLLGQHLAGRRPAQVLTGFRAWTAEVCDLVGYQRGAAGNPRHRFGWVAW